MNKYMTSITTISAFLMATSAQASCWSADAVTAAKVRNLDTMLMVSSLRCRNENASVMGVYSAFVNQNRGILLQANVELQRHFHSADALDHYATLLANHYGAGAVGIDCNSIAAIAQMTHTDGGSVPALAAIAEQAGLDPMLDDSVCGSVANR